MDPRIFPTSKKWLYKKAGGLQSQKKRKKKISHREHRDPSAARGRNQKGTADERK